MIKIGDKVYYFQTMNRVGTVVDIISESNNQLTVGGTTSARVYVKVEYSDGNHIAELRAGEFLFLPYDTGGSALLQLEASANTIQAEYAFFTRT